MNTDQLKRILDTDAWTRVVFRDVLPRNHTPSLENLCYNRPVGYILNTDPCNQPGEHWVALFIAADGDGDYFDSYGLPPLHPELTSLMTRGSRVWTWNTRQLQSIATAVCGQYCVFYELHRARGYTMDDIVHMFEGSPADNDTLVYGQSF